MWLRLSVFAVLVVRYFFVMNAKPHLAWSPSAGVENLLDFVKGSGRFPNLKANALRSLMQEAGIFAPLRIALPPRYGDHMWGNCDYTGGSVSWPDAIWQSAPYPHPAIKLFAPDHKSRFEFDTSSFNAALLRPMDAGGNWPLGYTTWIDLIFVERNLDVPTPILVTADGRHIKPRTAHAVHQLNHVLLQGARTRIIQRHWSPIVWDFDEPGHLLPGQSNFTVEANGREVSWISPLPSDGSTPVGLFLLQKVMPAAYETGPAWWALDVRLRQLVLSGGSFSEAKPILDELQKKYPGHPLLDHYRVVARLHDPSFTAAWLARQQRECDLSTWQLLPWTHAEIEDVAKLPCYVRRGYYSDMPREHILGTIMVRFHDLTKSEIVRDAVLDIVRKDPGELNYPLADYALLWRKWVYD